QRTSVEMLQVRICAATRKESRLTARLVRLHGPQYRNTRGGLCCNSGCRSQEFTASQARNHRTLHEGNRLSVLRIFNSIGLSLDAPDAYSPGTHSCNSFPGSPARQSSRLLKYRNLRP